MFKRLFLLAFVIYTYDCGNWNAGPDGAYTLNNQRCSKTPVSIQSLDVAGRGVSCLKEVSECSKMFPVPTRKIFTFNVEQVPPETA